MWTLPRLLPLSGLLTLCLIAVSGCQTPTPVTSACTAFPRITFSRLKDTEETIRQVKAYDAGRDAICGKGK